MWIGIVSLFPEMFQALSFGVIGRAIKEKRLTLAFFNPRTFTHDKHQSVDDTPYGGGPGMVMMAEPLSAAITAAKRASPKTPHVIYLSPQGQVFNQTTASQLANEEAIILIAGRYEGIDERVIESDVDEEWSIGDYVLTGGELPAMVMVDAITRLLPGVVGDHDSIREESFATGLLKYPQYTRPEVFQEKSVPDILLSGNHAAIKRFRLKQSLERTYLKRKDLLDKKVLTAEEQALLDECLK